MKLKDEAAWNSWQANNQDAYGGACVIVARRVMEILDEGQPFDCHEIITRADNETDTGGITGYMAGAVATMISQCHERGEEFRKQWNGDYGHTGEGVVNPAIITINVPDA